MVRSFAHSFVCLIVVCFSLVSFLFSPLFSLSLSLSLSLARLIERRRTTSEIQYIHTTNIFGIIELGGEDKRKRECAKKTTKKNKTMQKINI